MAKRSTRKSAPRKKSSKSSGGNNAGGIFLGVILIAVSVYVIVGDKMPIDFSGVTEDLVVESKDEKASSNEDKPSTSTRNEPQEKAVEPEDKEETKETNPAVPEYKDVDEYYFTNSFDFAWPSYDVDDLVVEHEGFTLSYNEKLEQADWVAYKLEKKNLDQAKFKRKDNFREDPLVRTGSATPGDYRKSGYDRGHLAPAADFTWSKKALDHTFYMSNMSPQEPGFNRGIWKKLEEQVRDWARDNQIVYVVTGPIADKRKGRIGDNKVTVPKYYYKVVLDIQEPELKAIAFLMENEKSNKDIMDFAVTVDRIEAMSGLDFFPSIPDEMENRLEKSIDENLWK